MKGDCRKRKDETVRVRHFLDLLVPLKCACQLTGLACFTFLKGGTTWFNHSWTGSLDGSPLFPKDVNTIVPAVLGTCKPFSYGSQKLIKVTQKQLLQNKALYIHIVVCDMQRNGLKQFGCICKFPLT